MHRLVLPILLTGFLLLCFAQDRPQYDRLAQRRAYKNAVKIFEQAERLLSQAGDDEKQLASTDAVYQLALDQFNRLIPLAETAADDSLLFFSRMKAALISFYLNKTEAARETWLAAFRLKDRLPATQDSFLFIPLLYSGGIYYEQNQFDSALILYKKAEAIQDTYNRVLDESERLYNRLGVMYYETGNYRKARNYFEKAITRTRASEINLVANYRINIASILIKLEEYDKAKEIYESLLTYGLYKDEIYHNLGIISQKLMVPDEAIGYFRKVNYTASKKNIDLYYNFAMAYSALGVVDSAELYYQKALAENLRWNGQRKNVQHGLILKFKGDEWLKKNDYTQALERYQESIRQFDTRFNETDIYSNPDDFSGVFSYINLFNTLAAKADALEKRFDTRNNISDLTASLDTYRAAFRLADYVERSYDSDEARLFLNRIKHSAHSRPIAISLRLYGLTEKKNYLEDAYFFDQLNKASVLSLNMQENESRLTGNNELYRLESSLRSTLTRLNLKASLVTDSSMLLQLSSEIRDAGIELSKVQERIKNDPQYREKHFTDRIPGVHALQKKLDNKTAILSWHLSPGKLLTLVITGNQFSYVETVINQDFYTKLDSFKIFLQRTDDEQQVNGNLLSSSLYKVLIAPLSSKLQNMTRLVIIPDDELYYLPFEALQDESRHFLVEKFSVQYQFSTALLARESKNKNAAGILAIAPFASRGYMDSSGTELGVLPASREEVTGLRGLILVDSIGTKENFLRAADNYGIIHLATHASVDNESPQRSFIAFYPGKADFKLYAGEIYDMRLDSADLIILSACETGTGQLIKGEGLMSLSRAFAFAGCPNIITSLWKAEDKTSSFITQRLHHYLEKGFSKDRALQQSKRDLLQNDAIDPRFKSPNYWANLLLIGDYESKHAEYPWWWVAAGLILGAIIFLFLKKK